MNDRKLRQLKNYVILLISTLLTLVISFYFEKIFFPQKQSDDPINYQLYIDIASNKINSKSFEEAISSYQKALTYSENDARANLGLANSYFSLEQFENSLYYSKKAISSEKNNNTDIKLYSNITAGDASSFLYKFDDALNYYKNALEFSNNNALIHVSIAYVYLQKTDYTKAIKHSDLAIFSKNNNNNIIISNANIIKSRSMLEIGEINKARSFLIVPLRVGVNLSEVYVIMGISYYKEKNYQKALEYFYKSYDYLNENKDQYSNFIYKNKVFELYKNIGKIFFYMDKFKDALDYLNKAQKINTLEGEEKNIHIKLTSK